jgi:predicted nuclease of predicted toxin-antitoxin system
VTLVLDENLSPRLVERLVTLFRGLIHVRDIGLKQASDEQIWEWAKSNNYTIVSADADFVTLSRRLGWPPKVIHIEKCDFPFASLRNCSGQNALRISEFDNDPKSGLLIIRLQPYTTINRICDFQFAQTSPSA